MTTVDISKLTYRPCVGIMVLNRDGLIWLGRRSDNKHNKPEGGGSWWQMPQGGIDAGEDPATAARRELFEETRIRSAEIIGEHPDWLNYDLPRDIIGKKWGGRYRGQTQKWFAMRFLGDDSEVDIAHPDHEVEFDEWRWARRSELMDLIVPFKAEVYQKVLAGIGTLAADV